MAPVPSSLASATRPASRPYRATVASVTRLGEHYRRVVFTSPRFEHFGTDRLDQRIKLVLPLADGHLADLGADLDDPGEPYAWYETWRETPSPLRNPLRTYTVRRVDTAARTVTVDFVCHGDTGPASAWVQRAVAGDEIILVGPDGRSEQSSLGIDFRPGTAHHLLLAGDETAAPAICAILEMLPATRDVHAFIEVPSAGDVLPVDHPASFAVTWLPRRHESVGELLQPAVTRWLEEHPAIVAAAAAPRPQNLADLDDDADLLWDSPPAGGSGELYAWLAGESSVIKALRRELVGGRGIDRKRVAFMGYWRQGRSENTG